MCINHISFRLVLLLFDISFLLVMFCKDTKKKHKAKKINKEIDEEETEESKKQRADLELVMMSSSDDEGRKDCEKTEAS